MKTAVRDDILGLPTQRGVVAKVLGRGNPAGFPAGPEGETPFFSERDLVVAVDQLGVFVLGRLRAAQEVDLLGDDLAAVAVVPHAVDPLGVVDAAVDEDLHALFAMLRDRLAETVEAGDAVPFGVHDPVAVLVAQDATFREAGAGGGEAEVGDLGATLGGADFGGLTDVAGEDDDVLHGKLLCVLSSGPSLRQDPEKARRVTRARWTERTPETPRGPGWSGQPQRGNTARTDAGLRARARTGLGDCQSKGWPRR
ncbi:hypothetical protein SDC9_52870 [bioreactor metagenome]|uniref:Uncharacterized protein n=1 Tax=bioreactor metagenome TaxID=1076179 RepID=A0A644WS98_9ZZZZ